ncbi:hypothetical protein [Urbifossiella limnaea]|uniref:Uncharacterized protein n=1 Tax=Urbifossiella limnaea TaxID=2528023 RepID=A0A517XNK2_9BACT|nr:hypothetical protein [Urbifossiella limnaea]QDU19087.1 hypothetical protein ETAA1_09900 [Urbifossiella limnaea]
MGDALALLPAAAAAVGGLIGVAVIAATARRTAEVRGGTSLLEYGRPVKVSAGAFWVLWVVVVVLSVTQPTDDPLEGAGIVLLFSALVLSYYLEVFGVRLEFDESGIRTRSPWRAGRRIGWVEVTRVWYNPILQWHVVETTNQGRVRLHDFLSGVGSLLTELDRRGVPGAKHTVS